MVKKLAQRHVRRVVARQAAAPAANAPSVGSVILAIVAVLFLVGGLVSLLVAAFVSSELLAYIAVGLIVLSPAVLAVAFAVAY